MPLIEMIASMLAQDNLDFWHLIQIANSSREDVEPVNKLPENLPFEHADVTVPAISSVSEWSFMFRQIAGGSLNMIGGW